MDWLERARAAADQPPLLPRVPLHAGAAVFGSAEPGMLDQMAAQSLSDGLCLLQKQEHGWVVTGELTHSLAQLAQLMRRLGLSGPWRDELLAVTDERGRLLGSVERALVRPLGITTRAVHLVGRSPDGRHWVQQRAFNKANDPGLWDTLVGGMIGADETVESALERETAEEAGLRLSALGPLQYGARVSLRRPSNEVAAGLGYLVEHIDWYSATVPLEPAPSNQDGEVAQFALLTREALLERLARGEFTLEAGLILAGALGLV
ncbi:MAG: NUDIX domain-containing protein [Burkholderiaceae bacterium]